MSQRIRTILRDATVTTLGFGRGIDRSTNWVAFPYYHHVFDDERGGFARQLDQLRSFGEFIDLDTAVRLLTSQQPIDGRYFCITFDDGFRNVVTNALPILVERNVPAAFFLATQFITAEGGPAARYDFFGHGAMNIEFLTWSEVRELQRNGMTIGSHTVSHIRLKDARLEVAEAELRNSKLTIEAETGRECRDFCAPFGIPGSDFDPSDHPEMAGRIGYVSFLTTRRGLNRTAGRPAVIYRDHMLSNWNASQVRYFFGTS